MPLTESPKKKKKSPTATKKNLGIAAKSLGLDRDGTIAHTLKRGETTVHDQLEITQLALREYDRGESLSLGDELILAGSIAGQQILEDTTVRRVGHGEI